MTDLSLGARAPAGPAAVAEAAPRARNGLLAARPSPAPQSSLPERGWRRDPARSRSPLRAHPRSPAATGGRGRPRLRRPRSGARARTASEATLTCLREDAASLTSSGARAGWSCRRGGVTIDRTASPRPRGSGSVPGCLRRSPGPGLGGAGRERTSAGRWRRRHGG